MPSLSLGLIGCGGIAKTHLEAIAKVPRIKLEAVYDVDAARALEVSKSFGCEAATHSDQILNNPGIQAVLICVPPVYHSRLVQSAIRAGKHVLCEKPFTVTLKDAEAIQKSAARSKVLVMMASKFRFVPDVIEARRLVQSGAVGDVVMSEVIFCSAVDMTKRWNSDPKIAGGGVLIDNGSHAVDVVRYLVGPIRSVWAQAGKPTQAVRVEDTARLHFETRGRVIGMVDLSWSLYKHTPNYVNIFGTLGTIEVGWQQSILWNAKEKTSRVFGGGYKKLEAFVNQMHHFADCLEHKAKPLFGIEDAVESVRVIETAYRSIQEKKWLKLF